MLSLLQKAKLTLAVHRPEIEQAKTTAKGYGMQIAVFGIMTALFAGLVVMMGGDISQAFAGRHR